MSYRSNARTAILYHAVAEAVGRNILDLDAPNLDPTDQWTPTLFSTTIGDNIPMRVWIRDWKFDETKVNVALWPKSEVDRWLQCPNAGKYAGDVMVSGYFERNNRVHLTNPFEKRIFISRSRTDTMKEFPPVSETLDEFRAYLRKTA